MDEKKLRLLNDFQKLSEGKSSEDMIPLVLAFMEKAKKENITFVDSCNTYNWSYCYGSNRKDFNVDRFICITC